MTPIQTLKNSLPLQVAIAIVGVWIDKQFFKERLRQRVSPNFLNHCLINMGTIAMARNEPIPFDLGDRAVGMSEVSISLPIHTSDWLRNQPPSTGIYVDRACLAQKKSH